MKANSGESQGVVVKIFVGRGQSLSQHSVILEVFQTEDDDYY